MYKISDSLTGTKLTFEPRTPGKVSLYLCGPTVYDEPHVGHLRSAYMFDVIRRILSDEYEVTFVRNVTDVDDKIIERANSLGCSSEELAAQQHQLYLDCLKRFSVQPVTVEPKATEHIPHMIRLIEGLIDKGFAYSSGANVYFSVRKFDSYGKLSGQNIDQMMDNWRGEAGEGKQDPLDFALWKTSKEGEPYWDSPWGKGRPGWHIECSAMSKTYCGDAFDIHGGGKDLIFPHHENERAQSMAHHGTFAKYWIHHGLITIDSRKMSKSLGNFVTLKDVEEKASIDALKLFFLQSHYSSDADFTWDKLTGIESSLRSLRLAFAECPDEPDADLLEIPDQRFMEALKDDFNTPVALGVLFHQFHLANKAKQAGDRKLFRHIVSCIRHNFQKYFSVFSGSTGVQADSGVLSGLLKLRQNLRKEKRFDLADQLRDAITSAGLVIEDSSEGSFIKDPDHCFDEKSAEKLEAVKTEIEAKLENGNGS